MCLWLVDTLDSCADHSLWKHCSSNSFSHTKKDFLCVWIEKHFVVLISSPIRKEMLFLVGDDDLCFLSCCFQQLLSISTKDQKRTLYSWGYWFILLHFHDSFQCDCWQNETVKNLPILGRNETKEIFWKKKYFANSMDCGNSTLHRFPMLSLRQKAFSLSIFYSNQMSLWQSSFGNRKCHLFLCSWDSSSKW